MARLFHGSHSYPTGAHGPVVTVGNFDGVHRGHQALLRRVADLAVARGTHAAVLTFDPAPVEVLAPERSKPRIQTLADRVQELIGRGFDVIVEPFDSEYAARDASWFAQEVLHHRLNASALVVGWDFRFGRDRAGDAAALSDWMAAPVERFGPWSLDGEVVSSSRIRRAVVAGEIATANHLLGRPHRLVGVVVHGDQRGRTLGFPTANLKPNTALLPPPGVYAVRAEFEGIELPGVMNIGKRPTFDGADTRYEVHLLDVHADLYGRVLPVDLIARLRDERRFEGPDDLLRQIHHDIAETRKVLA